MQQKVVSKMMTTVMTKLMLKVMKEEKCRPMKVMNVMKEGKM